MESVIEYEVSEETLQARKNVEGIGIEKYNLTTNLSNVEKWLNSEFPWWWIGSENDYQMELAKLAYEIGTCLKGEGEMMTGVESTIMYDTTARYHSQCISDFTRQIGLHLTGWQNTVAYNETFMKVTISPTVKQWVIPEITKKHFETLIGGTLQNCAYTKHADIPLEVVINMPNYNPRPRPPRKTEEGA